MPARTRSASSQTCGKWPEPVCLSRSSCFNAKIPAALSGRGDETCFVVPPCFALRASPHKTSVAHLRRATRRRLVPCRGVHHHGSKASSGFQRPLFTNQRLSLRRKSPYYSSSTPLNDVKEQFRDTTSLHEDLCGLDSGDQLDGARRCRFLNRRKYRGAPEALEFGPLQIPVPVNDVVWREIR